MPDRNQYHFKSREAGGEAEGLSGAPVRKISTEVIRQFHTILKDRIPIIGVGGISSEKDVQDKIEAGASLVQVYSGMIYEEPLLVKNLVVKI